MQKRINLFILGLYLLVSFLSLATVSSQNITCFDSDPSNNRYVLGFANDSQGFTQWDICIGNQQRESICFFSRTQQREVVTYEASPFDCPFGCANGSCLPCNDSDYGKNYSIFGIAKGINTNTTREVILSKDSCYLSVWPNIVSSCLGNDCYLSESYCNVQYALRENGIRCSMGCSEGRCVENVSEICVDSDKGLNYPSFGSVVDSNSLNGLEDYCVNSTTLAEYYCKKSDLGIFGEVKNYDCPAVCYNGACAECQENESLCLDNTRMKVCRNGKWMIENCSASFYSGKCNPSNNKCEPEFVSSCPTDTLCKYYWPAPDGRPITLNGGTQYSCSLFEVCNPSLNTYVEQARNSCSKSNDSKRCMGLFIISSLGKDAKFMKGYFTPEICCDGSANDFMVKFICKDPSYFGKCNSAEDLISSFNLNAQKLNCSRNMLFAWNSDSDMSKNPCLLVTFPAHVSLNILKTGTCEDYSVALTTLLRKAGYNTSEVLSVSGFRHMYNLVKFPGDMKYHVVDTTGNGKGLADNVIRINDAPLGKSRFVIIRTVKKGAFTLGIKSNVYYDYCGLPMQACYNDLGNVSCPNTSQIYGCEKSVKHYLDTCKLSMSIIKGTCKQCWYQFKPINKVEGCCKLKNWWGQYTYCRTADVSDVVSSS